MQRIMPISASGDAIPGIAPAVRTTGDLMFLSGHVPLDERGAVVSGGLAAQASQVFVNLAATLAAGGASFADVARLTIYVRGFEPDQLAVIREVRDRYVDVARPPASALIGVAALFHPDVLIEIDAIAVAPMPGERP